MLVKSIQIIMSLYSLPDHILVDVLLNNDLASLKVLSKTDRKFRRFCNDPHFWKDKLNKDFEIKLGNKSPQETYINLYHLSNKIPFEQWTKIILEIEQLYDMDQLSDLVGYMEEESKILYIKNLLHKSLYSTFVDKYVLNARKLQKILGLDLDLLSTTGSTILGELIQLYGNFDKIEDMDKDCDDKIIAIQNEIFKVYLYILDLGYDVNKDIDNNGMPIMTPMTEIMRMGGISEDTRWKFVSHLIENGLDINKTNIWNGIKYVNNYLEVFSDWCPINYLDNRIKSLFP